MVMAIERLRAIHEAATPGPWKIAETETLAPDGSWIIAEVTDVDLEPVLYADDGPGRDTTQADARAIAVEHNTYASLLAVAEAAMRWREAHGITYLPDLDPARLIPGDAWTTTGMAVTSNELAGALAALEAAAEARA